MVEEKNFDPFHDLERDVNGTLYFVNNFELAFEFWKLYFGI